MKKLDLKLVTNLTFGGIRIDDSPRFCDAFIETADYNGIPATEKQLDEMNEDSDFLHEQLQMFLY